MAGLASQQALEAVTQGLLTRAATLDDAALDSVAGAIGDFAGVLAAQPHLRRMLTENTVPAEAKEALARRLLADKVDEASLTVILAAVAQRWSTGSDLVDGLRRVSHTVRFVRAERSGDLDDVEDQLFRFGRILQASPALSVILDDPATPAEARAGLITQLLEGKAHPLTLGLLAALAADPGGRAFTHGVDQLVAEAAQRRDQLVAIVTSAMELSPDERDRLTSALSSIYARAVAIHVIVDPDLAGGLRVRVGDEVIDGSVAGRLETLRARLAGR